MFNLNLDLWDDYLDNWIDKNVGEFLDAVKSTLKDETFLSEIAASLAWSHYNNQDCCEFFDEFGLSDEHALCYLDYINSNGNYRKSVDAAYQEYITSLVD